jgi:hypothetical protein
MWGTTGASRALFQVLAEIGQIFLSHGLAGGHGTGFEQVGFGFRITFAFDERPAEVADEHGVGGVEIDGILGVGEGLVFPAEL